MKPPISIILPTYNGGHFIAGAIESVLAQTYTQWELLIISDGSVDATKEVVENYVRKDSRIIFIEYKKNSGIQRTLNKGIALATGKYIARIDDDDRWVDSTKLSAQVDFLEKNTEYVLVGTDAIVVDEKGAVLSTNIMPKNDAAIRSKILSKNCFLHATVLIRKNAIEKAGGYSEKVKHFHAEDYELWLRLGTVGKLGNLNMRSTALTAHAGSLTSRNRVLQARHIFQTMREYRNLYPNFLSGWCISLMRLVGFSVIAIIPIPSSLLYRIQRMYRMV
jgi:glycosyltransferase involved in cell wall biosynthesis